MSLQPSNLLELCDHELDSWVCPVKGTKYRGLAWFAEGTNTVTWVEDPSVAAGTGRTVMRITKTSNAAGGAQQVGFVTDIKKNRHGAESDAAGNRTFTELIATAKLRWSKAVSTAAWSGLLTLLPRFEDAGTNVLRVGFGARTGEVAYILGTGSTVVLTGVTIAENTVARLTARYVKGTGANGILQIWVDDTLIVNISNHAVTSNAVSSTQSFGFDHQIIGAINAAHVPIIIDYWDVGVADAQIWAAFDSTPSTFAGSGSPLAGFAFGQCRPAEGLGTSVVNVAFRSHAGSLRYDWRTADLEVCVEYSTASDLAGSTTTAKVDAPAADRWLADIPITGLAADTVYYYRVKANEDGDAGDVWSGPIRQFKTAPIDGKPAVGFTHCNDQAGGPFEWAELYRAQGVDYVIDLGDRIYWDSSDSPTGPSADKVGLIREYGVPFDCRLLQRYVHYRHLLTPLVSDHDGYEDEMNVAGGYMKGYIDAEGVNAAGANGSEYEADGLCTNSDLSGAGITIRELVDNAREVNYKWLRRSSPGRVRFAATPPANAWEDTEDFEAYDHGGGLHYMFWGTREWQDWAGSEPYNGTGAVCMMGEAFERWVYDQIDAIPSTCKVLAIFGDSPFCAANSVDDNWDNVARAQRREFLNYFKANLPAGCKVFHVGGDRHWRELDNRTRYSYPHVGGLSPGDDYTSVFLGEVVTGQGSKGILGQGQTLAELSDAAGVVKSDGAGVTRSPVNWARFGCIVDFNAPAKSVTVRFYAFDGSTLAPTAESHRVRGAGNRGRRVLAAMAG